MDERDLEIKGLLEEVWPLPALVRSNQQLHTMSLACEQRISESASSAEEVYSLCLYSHSLSLTHSVSLTLYLSTYLSLSLSPLSL